jgi:hypothetical protein
MCFYATVTAVWVLDKNVWTHLSLGLGDSVDRGFHARILLLPGANTHLPGVPILVSFVGTIYASAHLPAYMSIDF